MTQRVSPWALTLDSSVIQRLWDDPPRPHQFPYVRRLFDLASTGEVDLAVTSWVRDDIPREPRASLLSQLVASSSVNEEWARPFRLDISTLDGPDLLGHDLSNEFDDFYPRAQLLARERTSKKKQPPGIEDWGHLHGHLILKRDYFLTWDEPMLSLYGELNHDFGIRVVTPESFLRAHFP